MTDLKEKSQIVAKNTIEDYKKFQKGKITDIEYWKRTIEERLNAYGKGENIEKINNLEKRIAEKGNKWTLEESFEYYMLISSYSR